MLESKPESDVVGVDLCDRIQNWKIENREVLPTPTPFLSCILLISRRLTIACPNEFILPKIELWADMKKTSPVVRK